MLIRDAEVWRGGVSDVRISGGKVSALGHLEQLPGETTINARGGALLPGLHDHHIHLAATAAAMTSMPCGPPDVHNADDLGAALNRAGRGWLRGIAYHESVAGMLTRQQIDTWQSDRPVRIQHRSGRMWFFNSRALDLLRASAKLPASFDIERGQLFDADDWLRGVLSSSPPDLKALSLQLAEYGITGVTEISPSNSLAEADWLGREIARGNLLQNCVLAGRPDLTGAELPAGIALGPLKLHLHEHRLPEFDAVVGSIAAAHRTNRPIAVHCTTEVELVFTLAALSEAGAIEGDRIEHAGIATDTLIQQMAELKVQVVSQPHFISERGDQYLASVPAADHHLLYRLQSFAQAGVPLAAGSDAPYGSTDPWASMAAACSRRTGNGQLVGPAEALSPEEALSLFLRDPLNLRVERRIAEGAQADLCLLDRPWAETRKKLQTVRVRATLIGGKLIDDRIDKTPFQSRLCADTAA